MFRSPDNLKTRIKTRNNTPSSEKSRAGAPPSIETDRWKITQTEKSSTQQHLSKHNHHIYRFKEEIVINRSNHLWFPVLKKERQSRRWSRRSEDSTGSGGKPGMCHHQHLRKMRCGVGSRMLITKLKGRAPEAEAGRPSKGQMRHRCQDRSVIPKPEKKQNHRNTTGENKKIHLLTFPLWKILEREQRKMRENLIYIAS